jgi:hypothetical protein
MLADEVLIAEFLAVDAFAAGAVAMLEVAALQEDRQTTKHNSE